MSDREMTCRYFLGCPAAVLTRCCILTPVLSLKDTAAWLEEPVRFKGAVVSGCSGKIANTELTILKVPMGTFFVYECVKILVAAGVHRMVFLGLCGGLQGVTIGDWIIPVRTMVKDTSEEGLFTVKDHRFVSSRPEMDEIIHRCLISSDGTAKVHTGTVASVNTLLTQPRFLLSQYREEGIAAIDLEVAGFFSAAASGGCQQYAAALWVSDLPLRTPLGSSVQQREQQRRRAHFIAGCRAIVSGMAVVED